MTKSPTEALQEWIEDHEVWSRQDGETSDVLKWIEIKDLLRELTHLKDVLIEVRRVYPRRSGLRGQLVTVWDTFESILASLPEKPSYEDKP